MLCQRQHSALTSGPFHRRGRATERRDGVGDEGQSYVPDDLEMGLAGTVSLHERSAGPKQESVLHFLPSGDQSVCLQMVLDQILPLPVLLAPLSGICPLLGFSRRTVLTEGSLPQSVGRVKLLVMDADFMDHLLDFPEGAGASLPCAGHTGEGFPLGRQGRGCLGAYLQQSQLEFGF